MPEPELRWAVLQAALDRNYLLWFELWEEWKSRILINDSRKRR